MDLRDRDLHIEWQAKQNSQRFMARARAADRDDLLQEARIGAWKALQKIDPSRPDGEQRAYVGRAAHSHALNFIRWMARHQGRETPMVDGDLVVSTDHDPTVNPQAQARQVLTTAIELAEKRKQRRSATNLRRLLAKANDGSDRFWAKTDPALQGLIVEAAKDVGLEGLIRRCR